MGIQIVDIFLVEGGRVDLGHVEDSVLRLRQEESLLVRWGLNGRIIRKHAELVRVLEGLLLELVEPLLVGLEVQVVEVRRLFLPIEVLLRGVALRSEIVLRS